MLVRARFRFAPSGLADRPPGARGERVSMIRQATTDHADCTDTELGSVLRSFIRVIREICGWICGSPPHSGSTVFDPEAPLDRSRRSQTRRELAPSLLAYRSQGTSPQKGDRPLPDCDLKAGLHSRKGTAPVSRQSCKTDEQNVRRSDWTICYP